MKLIESKQAHAIAAYKIKSSEEAKEKGQKGGKASGESRRIKSEVKRILKTALSMRPNEPDMADLYVLCETTDKPTYLTAIVANLVRNASTGNISAINAIMKLLD